MKSLLFITALAFNLALINCTLNDHNNGPEPFANYDTNVPMEHINSQDSAAAPAGTLKENS